MKLLNSSSVSQILTEIVCPVMIVQILLLDVTVLFVRLSILRMALAEGTVLLSL